MPSQGGSTKEPRKEANHGNTLKKFEATLRQMFTSPPSSSSSTISSNSNSNSPSPRALDLLTPHYSALPPRLPDAERTKLIENAREYWKERGLLPMPESVGGRQTPSADTTNSTCDDEDDDYGKEEDSDSSKPSPWPFDDQTSLPFVGHVRQSQDPNNTKTVRRTTKTKTGKDKGGVGDILHSQRAWRKEVQLANIIDCVLSFVHAMTENAAEESNTKIRIVDFAGGTGHLAVPLALLLPKCEVVCVDLKQWSLDLLRARVDGYFDVATNQEVSVQHEFQATETLSNLYTYYGSIQSYSGTFDIGVSLHACGEASDWVLRKCIEKNACFVVCSCCSGKLSRDAANPYTYHSTGRNETAIRYPQSKVFSSLGQGADCRSYNDDTRHKMTPDMFDDISKAADYSELGNLCTPRNACRRAAKSLVEWDRLLYVKEYTDYSCRGNVILTSMLPSEASPKNDIIIGWTDDRVNPYRHAGITTIGKNESCHRDFQKAINHLFEV